MIRDIRREYDRLSQTDRDAARLAVLNCEHDLKAVNSAIARLVAAIRDAGHSPALLAELHALEKRQSELQEAISRAIGPPVEHKINIDIQAVSGALLAASDQEKGIILRGFVDRIRVEKIDGQIVGEIDVQGITVTL